MRRFKYLMSSMLFAGALVASPTFADDDSINSPEIRPIEEQMALPMNDMFEGIEPSESFDIARFTYCYDGSVVNEATDESVDPYGLCQAEVFEIG